MQDALSKKISNVGIAAKIAENEADEAEKMVVFTTREVIICKMKKSIWRPRTSYLQGDENINSERSMKSQKLLMPWKSQ